MVIPAGTGMYYKPTGVLGGWFQTPLYHLHPCRRVHKWWRELLLGICQAWQRSCRDGDRLLIVSVVIPAKAGIHAYRDVGDRAASGTGGRGRRSRGVKRAPALECGIKLSFPLTRECIMNPLDSGLRRNDGTLVVISVLISVCP